MATRRRVALKKQQPLHKNAHKKRSRAQIKRRVHEARLVNQIYDWQRKESEWRGRNLELTKRISSALLEVERYRKMADMKLPPIKTGDMQPGGPRPMQPYTMTFDQVFWLQGYIAGLAKRLKNENLQTYHALVEFELMFSSALGIESALSKPEPRK